MISRIASRTILALKGQITFVLGVLAFIAVFSAATIGYSDWKHGHSILDRLHSTQASPDCSRRVIALVAGNLDNISGAQQCFAASTRYAQMPADTFEQFVRRAAPAKPVEFVEVGTVPGETPGNAVVVFALRDGDPNTVATLYLDSEGKVTSVAI